MADRRYALLGHAHAAAAAEVNDLSAAVTWANIPIANVPTGTSGTTVALGDHTHTNATNWDTAYGWGDWSAHVHEGTVIDATAVTDGWVLTADGAGNSAWEAVPAGGGEVNDLSAAVTWANIPIANVPTGTSGTTVALGNHVHSGVYEPVDATIVRTGDAAWNATNWDTAYGWGDWAATVALKINTTSVNWADYSDDMDTNFNRGNFRVNAAATNTPVAGQYYATMVYGNGGNVSGQLATHFTSGDTYVRAYNTGWSTWELLLTDANLGVTVQAYDVDTMKSDVDKVVTAAWSVPSTINTQNGAYTLVLGDAGKTIRKATSATSITHTIPANSAVPYPIGTMIAWQNDGTVDMTIAITSDTLTDGNGSTTSKTLGPYDSAVIQKVATTEWKYAATLPLDIANLVDKSAAEVITGEWSVPAIARNKTASYPLVLGDAGQIVRFTGATASKVCTIPANTGVAFPIGTMIGITNDGSATMTLVITTDTMTWGKDNTTGTRTLGPGADCVILKTTATTWKINGSSLVT